MSLVFNMVGGGGGKAFAAISAIYPAGSTCTCSNETLLSMEQGLCSTVDGTTDTTNTAYITTAQRIPCVPNTPYTVTAPSLTPSGSDGEHSVVFFDASNAFLSASSLKLSNPASFTVPTGSASMEINLYVGTQPSTMYTDITLLSGQSKKTFTALNTSGTALFVIPYAATWTLTATDGTDTASETVGITTEGQIMSVELLYKIFLFKDGQINTELTGGINGTVQNDVIYFSKEISVGNNKTFTTKEKIDLTKAKSIMARMVSPNTVAALYFRLLVDDNEKNGENVTTSYLVAYEGVTSPFNSEEKIVSLDVSSLSGEYYLGYAWGVSTSASESRTVTGRIYEWWLQ